jgi:hypothetical protein
MPAKEMSEMRRIYPISLLLISAAVVFSQEAPRPDTPVWGRLRDALSTKTAKQDDLVFASIESSQLPPGSWAVLRVSESRQPGMVGGRGKLCLRLERFQLPGGQRIPGDAGILQAIGSTRVDADGCVVGPSSVRKVAFRALKWALVVGGITGGAVAAINSVNMGSLDPQDKRSIRNGVALGGSAIAGALIARTLLRRGEHLQLQAGEQVQLLIRSSDIPKAGVPAGGETWKPPSGPAEQR